MNKAEVSSVDDGSIKEYIGMTSNEFKERYRNHQKSFIKGKRKQQRFRMKWTVLKHVSVYRSGSRRCNLCIEEKLQIMLRNKKSLLDRRSEIFVKCRHPD